ncbi:hypothetical protein F4819DRAFT_491686 [Hypoxylon fuscum]|nr:hypothetical protein F4819DRAFT_491686 [Hypoxylon fuscum]
MRAAKSMAIDRSATIDYSRSFKEAFPDEPKSSVPTTPVPKAPSKGSVIVIDDEATNQGLCLVAFTDATVAKEAVEKLNDFSFRGRKRKARIMVGNSVQASNPQPTLSLASSSAAHSQPPATATTVAVSAALAIIGTAANVAAELAKAISGIALVQISPDFQAKMMRGYLDDPKWAAAGSTAKGAADKAALRAKLEIGRCRYAYSRSLRLRQKNQPPRDSHAAADASEDSFTAVNLVFLRPSLPQEWREDRENPGAEVDRFFESYRPIDTVYPPEFKNVKFQLSDPDETETYFLPQQVPDPAPDNRGDGTDTWIATSEGSTRKFYCATWREPNRRAGRFGSSRNTLGKRGRHA